MEGKGSVLFLQGSKLSLISCYFFRCALKLAKTLRLLKSAQKSRRSSNLVFLSIYRAVLT